MMSGDNAVYAVYIYISKKRNTLQNVPWEVLIQIHTLALNLKSVHMFFSTTNVSEKP